jgi:hypothetical protein
MDIIASPFTHIINLSISSGIVPDLMKIARVVPLFKSGDHRLFQNYRPISIIPIFAKLLERVVHKRILDYININNSCIFFNTQYGFRKKPFNIFSFKTKSKFSFVLRPIYTVRLVVYDSYSGVCDRINTRTNVTFQISPSANEQ